MFRRCYVQEMLCSEGTQISNNNYTNMAIKPNSPINLYSQVVQCLYNGYVTQYGS